MPLPMELAPVPRDPDEPFVPDLSEGAEAGLYLSLFELMNEGLIITSVITSYSIHYTKLYDCVP